MALADRLFGRRLATDEEGEHRIGGFAAIPMLGLDALGSSACGPEAVLTLQISLDAAGVGRADAATRPRRGMTHD